MGQDKKLYYFNFSSVMSYSSMISAISGGLGPLHGEDQMVVAEAVQGGDGLGRVLLLVVVHERKALQNSKFKNHTVPTGMYQLNFTSNSK